MIPVSIGSFGGRDAWLPDYRYGTHVVRTKPEDEAREAVVAAARAWSNSEDNDVAAEQALDRALDRLDALTKGDA